jgi:hypothetical protein
LTFIAFAPSKRFEQLAAGLGKTRMSDRPSAFSNLLAEDECFKGPRLEVLQIVISGAGPVA